MFKKKKNQNISFKEHAGLYILWNTLNQSQKLLKILFKAFQLSSEEKGCPYPQNCVGFKIPFLLHPGVWMFYD